MHWWLAPIAALAWAWSRNSWGARWDVVATARQPSKAAELKAVAEQSPGRLTILKLEMNDPGELDGFASGLGRQMLDVALINAGIAGPGHQDASVVDSRGDRVADVH